MKKIIIVTQEPFYFEKNHIFFNNKIYRSVIKGISESFEISKFIGKIKSKENVDGFFKQRVNINQLLYKRKKIYNILSFLNTKNDVVIIFSASIFTFYHSIILKLIYPKSKFFLISKNS